MQVTHSALLHAPLTWSVMFPQEEVRQMADLINILWYKSTQGLLPFFYFVVLLFLIVIFDNNVSSSEKKEKPFCGIVFISIVAGTMASFFFERPRVLLDIIELIKYIFSLFKWWSIFLCFAWMLFRGPVLKNARLIKITILLFISVSLLSVTILKYTYADHVFLEDVRFWENAFKSNGANLNLNIYKEHISSHAENRIDHTLHYDYQGNNVSGPSLSVLYKIYTSDNIYTSPFRKIARDLLSHGSCYPGTNIIHEEPRFLNLIASHQNLNIETFYAIYYKFGNKYDILHSLSRNESAPQEFLKRMIGHPSSFVRIAIAYNEGASENILSELEENEKNIIEIEKRKEKPDPVVLSGSKEVLSAISQMRQVRKMSDKGE